MRRRHLDHRRSAASPWPSGLALAGPGPARRPAPPGPRARARDGPRPRGTRRALIVCGLPGDDEHRAMYAGAVEKIARALVDRCGFAAAGRLGPVRRRAEGRRRPGPEGEPGALDPREHRRRRRGDPQGVDARGRPLGDRPGPRPLRRPAVAPEPPRPRPLRRGVRPALRGDQGEGAGLLRHHLGQRLLPQAARRPRAGRDLGHRGRPGGQRDPLPARPGRRPRRPPARGRPRQGRGALGLRALPGRRRRRDPPLRRGRADPHRARPARRQRRRPGHRGPADLPPPRVGRRGRGPTKDKAKAQGRESRRRRPSRSSARRTTASWPRRSGWTGPREAPR